MPDRDCSLLCMDAIGIGVDIAMVVVGVSYMGEEKAGAPYCQFDAPTFLIFAGILSLVATIVRFLTYVVKIYISMKDEDQELSLRAKCCQFLMASTSLLVMVCKLVVLIWGSVVIFGNYGGWKSSGRKSYEGYCAYTPMQFSFVILILKWIELPVAVFVVCIGVVCCGKSISN